MLENFNKSLIKNSHYWNRYVKFITYLKYRPPVNGVYTEKHHIIPVSVDSTLRYDEKNLVVCTGREHYLLHFILAKALMSREMIFAFNQMKRCAKTSTLYHVFRAELSEYLRIENTGRRHTDAAKRKMSLSRVGTVICRNVDTGARRKMQVDSIPDGWVYDSCGRRRSKLGRERLSNAMTGRIWITNGTENKFVHSDNIPTGYKPGYSYSYSKEYMKYLSWWNDGKNEGRFYTSPGVDWNPGRLFHNVGLEKANSCIKMFDLKAKEFVLVEDESKIKEFYIYKPGRNIDNVLLFVVENVVYCGFTNFPFRWMFQKNEKMTTEKFNSLVITEHGFGKKPPRKKEYIEFLKAHNGKTFKDLGMVCYSFSDFNWNDAYSVYRKIKDDKG